VPVSNGHPNTGRGYRPGFRVSISSSCVLRLFPLPFVLEPFDLGNRDQSAQGSQQAGQLLLPRKLPYILRRYLKGTSRLTDSQKSVKSIVLDHFFSLKTKKPEPHLLGASGLPFGSLRIID